MENKVVQDRTVKRILIDILIDDSNWVIYLILENSIIRFSIWKVKKVVVFDITLGVIYEKVILFKDDERLA